MRRNGSVFLPFVLNWNSKFREGFTMIHWGLKKGRTTAQKAKAMGVTPLRAKLAGGAMAVMIAAGGYALSAQPAYACSGGGSYYEYTGSWNWGFWR
ncbi:MAG: hypothetical protein ACJAVO_000053 [Parvibaculaceae bacterium]|jgi:hypothetical protein|tara:strand:- start:126 stop:413 length:288 start_codon:yes stop_codon:yes gene_type:complete